MSELCEMRVMTTGYGPARPILITSFATPMISTPNILSRDNWGGRYYGSLAHDFPSIPYFSCALSHLSSYLVLRFSTILTRVYYASGRVRTGRRESWTGEHI